MFYSRKQLRIPYFDYSQNSAYFVTVCTYNRKNILGSVSEINSKLRVYPNICGEMIAQTLKSLEEKYPGINIDCFCVMPNHLHFILFKLDSNSNLYLSDIIKWFKTQTTNKFIKLVKSGKAVPFEKHVWQRGYYEHIIRNERDLEEIRKYIEENPIKWIFDKYYNEFY